MKPFRVRTGKEDISYKLALVMIAATVLMVFAPSMTGMATGDRQSALYSTALAHPDVQLFLKRNKDYQSTLLALDEAELSYLSRKYPLLYAGVPAPSYELRLETGKEGILILLDERTVHRVFNYPLD